jgi:hypothetical protein
MRGWTIGLTLVLWATAGSAQTSRTITVPATARWQHARSEVILPTRIGDLPRRGIVENTADEVDVGAHYEDASTRITVVLFRPQQADVGVWFDRAEQVLASNPMLRDIAPVETAPVAFAPPGGNVLSGLRRAYISSGEWRATATALYPTGRWLVKIRVSSSTRDANALSRLIDAAIAGITLHASAITPPPARIILPCATPVRWRTARAMQPSMMDALLGAAMISMAASGDLDDADDPAEAAPRQPVALLSPTLCRDATPLAMASAYRDPAVADAYWVALGDAGAVGRVGPAMTIEGVSDRNAAIDLSIATPTGGGTYAQFNRVPSPEQAYRLLTTGGPGVTISFDPERAPAEDAPAASTPGS